MLGTISRVKFINKLFCPNCPPFYMKYKMKYKSIQAVFCSRLIPFIYCKRPGFFSTFFQFQSLTIFEEMVKSMSLSLCLCYVCVIVINQNCQKQGKLCKLFLHMPSTEFANAQLQVNRVCTCSVKGKHDTKP